jgi:hypothetical protein
MIGIKKFIGITLAVVVVTSAVLAQSVPVGAKTQAISISNVKKGKATLYKGQRLSFKTNYKENQLKVSTSDKNVVSVKGIKITGVNKGTAKITVAVKSNTKVKKTITVKVVDRYIIRKDDAGGESDKIVEKYDRKTKKSTYTVEVKGKDVCNNVDMNIKYRFTSKDTHMRGTGCAGEMSNIKSYISVRNATKGYDKEFRTFEKLSDNDLYKYYELTKAEIKQTKISRSETAAGYMLAVSTPVRNGMYTDCLIKDKTTNVIYEVQYKGSEDPYTVYKSIKVIK